jgi:dTDP-4-amino-4,6-dideoxygalactose transaminase
LGAKHVYACSSGTAAVHAAVAALDPEPGDEIVSSPITDMGALTPILYQGAIPVFADVDPRTSNVTAETIAARLSPKTRAIVATHLFGNPCDMGPILELARSRGLPVIEDCAQSFGAAYAGRRTGALGALAAFSLQQGKHITTGEGGLVATDDDALARRLFLFINKAWGYGDPQPDHYFLALNCRMSELQGAVGVAQLPKLAGVVERRLALAGRLTERLQGIPGVETPWSYPKATPSYWKYCLRVDPALVAGGPQGLAGLLREGEIASAPRYIQKPAFRCEVFEKQRTFGASRWPFTLARPEAVDYDAARFPGTFAALERILVLPWNERLSEAHVDHIASTLRDAALRLARAGRR